MTEEEIQRQIKISKAVFQRRIKELRTERNLSQKQAAQLLQIPLSTYRKWEKGTAFPYTNQIVTIARTYRVTAKFLVGI